MPAGDLYAGRSMVLARDVARSLDAQLYIVSAGLGLVSASELVPCYDLTVVGARSPIKAVLGKTHSDPSDWWTAITRSSHQSPPLSRLICEPRTQLVFIALPASYMGLVAKDLASVPMQYAQRVRIFSSLVGQQIVPPSLQSAIMPYDERLESLRGFDGTRAEFPQRALRHFIHVIQGHKVSLETARNRVECSLSELPVRSIPVRERRSDTEIAKSLLARWNEFGGSATRLLRYLRDDAKVACEQSRFRSIWLTLKTEIERSR